MRTFVRLAVYLLSAFSGALLSAWPAVEAAEFDTSVPMRTAGTATYYVGGYMEGVGDVDFMVDTGSGYVTINEETLAALQKENRVRYVRKLRGVMADGSELTVPVYRIETLSIGGLCHLNDVEAAVFPGKTRQILGLSALKKAAPFIFSFDPPNLVLSNCPVTTNVAAAKDS